MQCAPILVTAAQNGLDKLCLPKWPLDILNKMMGGEERQIGLLSFNDLDIPCIRHSGIKITAVFIDGIFQHHF